ncbi:MAG: hypothetical protein Q8M43_09970 [Sulfuricurvum sp.]|uniref:GTP pyrophosphokinase n=1 Tax=Sulfuricurvum sp. TaxID=2025608 RepID=UPI0027354534|nr:hypothetical protein [Sulfuricurvum sp.]MDP3292343.1 hypothetical protein [Sulfuricurvum sp.]
MDSSMPPKEEIDLKLHAKNVISDYLKVFNFYDDLAKVKSRIVEEALKRHKVQVHSVQARAKKPDSFERKAAKPAEENIELPKYPDPLKQITDLSAIRIITFFPRTIKEIDEILKKEFEIIEHFDKSEDLEKDEKFGYQSVHYLVKLKSERSKLPEYERFSDAITEVQVRTILQHAWAEIEHDIQYKSSIVIPKDIKRRFMSLAGLLEIADREFQAIQDADRILNDEAKVLVNEGKLKGVELTPVALKSYLDKKLGSDARMSDFSYDWTIKLLKKLGFDNLEQVDNCISQYDDDKISRLLAGYRQGQLTRFEYMLLAGMGEKYIERHLFTNESWYGENQLKQLQTLKKNKVLIGSFDPYNG